MEGLFMAAPPLSVYKNYTIVRFCPFFTEPYGSCQIAIIYFFLKA
jgi:hypothetical protein